MKVEFQEDSKRRKTTYLFYYNTVVLANATNVENLVTLPENAEAKDYVFFYLKSAERRGRSRSRSKDRKKKKSRRHRSESSESAHAKKKGNYDVILI